LVFGDSKSFAGNGGGVSGSSNSASVFEVAALARLNEFNVDADGVGSSSLFVSIAATS
jgi:hypothetical protein